MRSFFKTGLLFLFVPAVFSDAGSYLSPTQIVYSPSGAGLYIAQSEGKRVDLLDVVERNIINSIELQATPSGIALSKDDQKLYITAGISDGHVLCYDLDQNKVTATIPVGHSPMSPVLSNDQKTMYICNRFSNNITVIDLTNNSVAETINVIREPVSAALTPDETSLFVANHLPAGAADADYTSSQISVIDTVERKLIANIALPNGSTGIRGICISPDGKYVYVTHILARYQLPTTQLDRGWMNTNAVSIIDVAGRKLYNTVLLDDVDHGAANPWAIACSSDGKFLLVTLAGTNELSIIDRNRLHQKLEDLAAGKKVSNVINSFDEVSRDLSFLYDIRKRVKLKGYGARSLAVTKGVVFVGQYFTDSICVVALTADQPKVETEMTLNQNFKMTVEHQGEIFFNDASLCFQNWQSCASCHPDGRTDGLNWDLLNDGIGNPKNTKSMLLAHQTPPAMITGIRDKAETAVRAGIRYIQFAQRPEEDAAAIDAYLKSLKPIPSPYLQNGQLSESAKRGQKLYVSAGCATCHSGPAFTNQKTYNVETGLGREQNTSFDTPGLVEIWRTAPYLNRGQSPTMKHVLVEANANDRHGKISNLTPQELNDLIEYILSL